MANVPAFIDKLSKPSLFAKVLHIYMLDDYSSHLGASVRKKMLARGYIPIYFGGGITGDVQVNDTRARIVYSDLVGYQTSNMRLLRTIITRP